MVVCSPLSKTSVRKKTLDVGYLCWVFRKTQQQQQQQQQQDQLSVQLLWSSAFNTVFYFNKFSFIFSDNSNSPIDCITSNLPQCSDCPDPDRSDRRRMMSCRRCVRSCLFDAGNFEQLLYLIKISFRFLYLI